jgi:hypothetical protein
MTCTVAAIRHVYAGQRVCARQGVAEKQQRGQLFWSFRRSGVSNADHGNSVALSGNVSNFPRYSQVSELLSVATTATLPRATMASSLVEATLSRYLSGSRWSESPNQNPNPTVDPDTNPQTAFPHLRVHGWRVADG